MGRYNCYNKNDEPIVILGGVIKESLCLFKYSVLNNLGRIGTGLQVIIPHICLLGVYETGYNVMWVIIPFILYYVTYIIKQVNMVYNNRTVDNVPVPYRRFTQEGADGEILVENSRIQEMILYVNDLENELERLGKL